MTWLKIARLRKTIANFLGENDLLQEVVFSALLLLRLILFCIDPDLLLASWEACNREMTTLCIANLIVFIFLFCRYLRAPPFISILFRVKYDILERGDNEFKEHNSWFHYLFFLSTPPFLVNLINFIKTAVTPNDQHWLSN